jgi:hypothetical protein
MAAPEELYDLSAFSSEFSCGTARCNAGWAAVDPWFQKNTTINQTLDPVTGNNSDCDQPIQGDGCNYASIHEHLEFIFGLSNNNVHLLFYPQFQGRPCGKGITKPMALAQIDRLLAGLDTVPYEELAVTA